VVPIGTKRFKMIKAQQYPRALGLAFYALVQTIIAGVS
jgi:hypothetical protein